MLFRSHKSLLMLGIIWSLQTYALIGVMTGGGPNHATEMPGTYIFMKEVYSNTREKMTKTVSVLGKDYASIRAGRANPGVLDKVLVDYYGVPTPINQMAAISVSEARILVIQPWDKSTLTPIYKAIQASDIGINPQNDGSVIRLTFPQLRSEERRVGKECRSRWSPYH